ncbi:DUF7344 domain-containing protein [Halopiger djelfimassiliensis]|uniref:DUF7344 domain-containing protein n=1 Tax=Halopiger djelfimassiliensis TaxID=1293047 RepID=UPI0006776733|nr:hypothetical protein [Halopiger djelfimassiliensis]
MSRSAPVDVERFVRVTDVPVDDAYTLLADARTRITLHVLSACETPLSVDRLTNVIARWDDAAIDRVRITLVHDVLPTLEAYDIVEYDGGTVRMESPVVALEEPPAEIERGFVGGSGESTPSSGPRTETGSG